MNVTAPVRQKTQLPGSGSLRRLPSTRTNQSAETSRSCTARTGSEPVTCTCHSLSGAPPQSMQLHQGATTEEHHPKQSDGEPEPVATLVDREGDADDEKDAARREAANGRRWPKGQILIATDAAGAVSQLEEAGRDQNHEGDAHHGRREVALGGFAGVD